MNWRDIPSLSALRAFEAAARLGSYSAAAREFNVTHAAIAQHVRTLEEHFGAPLMVRQGRSMATTPEGHALAQALGEGFGVIGSAARDLLTRGEARALRIAVTSTFAGNWLMPRIGSFWAEHPEIELELIPSSALVDLRADAIDVAIRFGRGGWPGVEITPLMPADLVAVASPGLLDASRVSCLADLKGCIWLLDGSLSEEHVFAAANGVDLEQETVKVFATAQLAREAALAGAGVTILPAPLVEDAIRNGRLRLLCRNTPSDVAYHILTRPGVVSAKRDAFIRWLRRQAKAA